MIESLLNKFRNMLCKVVLSGDQVDNGYVTTANAKAFGQETTAETIQPYGFYSVPPAGAVAVKMQLSAQPDNQVLLCYDPTTRFKGGEAGETVTGNQITQTYIKFNQDGSIDIKSNSIVNVMGNMTIKGNLIVDGTINATQAITSDSDVADGAGTSISAVKSAYNPHTHSDPQGGNTGTPSTPI